MKIPNKKQIAKRLKELPTGRFQYRCEIGGKTKKHSPETTDRLLAADRVKIWLEAQASGNFEVASKIEQKAPEKVMTIAQIIQIYERLANIKHRTVINNLSAFRTYLGDNKLTIKDPVSKLNKLQAEAWIRTRTGKGDEEQQAKAAYSANSLLRQAKSIFKKDLLPHYELGEGFDFHRVKVTEAKCAKFRPATDGRYRNAWLRINALKESDPQLHGAFILAAAYGLRNSEAGKAKKSWLLEDCFDVRLSKTDTDRQLPYQSEGDRELLLSINPDGEYILAGTKTERNDFVWRRLNKVLRSVGFTGQKGVYELRKYFGSQVALQTKSVWQAAQMLGNTPEVARQHYVGLLETPKYKIQREEVA